MPAKERKSKNYVHPRGSWLKRLAIVLLPLGLIACGDTETTGLARGEERAASDEAQTTARMIEAIKKVSEQRHGSGQHKRFNQTKSLGCLEANFVVAADLPAALKQGIFAEEKTYSGIIRFANASKDDDREKDFRGMSIKLHGVGEEPLWGESGVQDFLLNSYPALFAANPSDFLSFIEALRDDKLWRYFIRPSHFYSLRIVLKGREKITSPFAIRYFSTTPYRFGSDETHAVKYAVQACANSPPPPNVEPHQNFLTDAMAQHLAEAPACFDFMVQFQQDASAMPIEDAAVVWDEQRSAFLKVATITIDDQAFNSPERQRACEAMSFNPWQSLAAHRPLGGINRVRKPVYSEIAEFRRTHQGNGETR